MRNSGDTESHNILKIMDTWLPPGIRDNGSLSLEALIRSRVLACILLCSIGTTLFSLVTCALLFFFTGYDFRNPIIISSICLVLVALNYLYFYKSAKLDASGIFYSLAFFSVSVVAIVFTGGNDSPVKQILICCPVVSFLISGRHEGFYNAALVFVVGIVLLILDEIDFSLLQIMPENILPYLSGMIGLVTITLIVVCLYIYDLLLDQKRSIRAKQ